MTAQLPTYATLIVFGILFAFSLWQSRRLAFGRQFVVALLVTLISLQVLFFLQGYVGTPDEGSSELELLLFATALIAGFSACMQLGLSTVASAKGEQILTDNSLRLTGTTRRRWSGPILYAASHIFWGSNSVTGR